MRLCCYSFVVLLSPQVCLSHPYLSATTCFVRDFLLLVSFGSMEWGYFNFIFTFLTGLVLCNIVRFFFCLKATIRMNRSEIWSNIKREFVRIKMGWKHYQTVAPPPPPPPNKKGESPAQFGRGLFGISLPLFHILTYPLRKNISFPKCPKINQKFTQTAKQWLVK